MTIKSILIIAAFAILFAAAVGGVWIDLHLPE